MEQTYPTKAVENLIPGDLVDLQNDKWADPSGENVYYEFELCTVCGSERETPDCIRVDFESAPSVGFPPDHHVKIGGFDKEYAIASIKGATQFLSQVRRALGHNGYRDELNDEETAEVLRDLNANLCAERAAESVKNMRNR